MKVRTKALLLLAVGVAGIGLWRAWRGGNGIRASSVSHLPSWSAVRAASYLDQREVSWQHWPPAQQDHGTICISCHTVVPYALARPVLRRGLGETGMTAGEQTMLRSLDTRVTHWSEVSPFYSDAKAGPGKSAESRATEAVLNAVILASYDTALGQLRSVTRTAFEEAWALQLKLGEDAGGWQWQDFHLAPWESASSAYQGAAMLAIAVEEAPDHYADEAQIATNLELLEAYLKRQYPSEPLIGQLYVLWASARMPRLLDASQRAQLEGRIDALEQADGGWSLYSLDAKESWNHLQELSASDGCATALVVLALEQSGVSRQDAALRRGVAWLQHHQYEDGSWRAASLNKNRNPETQVGRFMSDAATGYASLALEMYQSTSARRPAPAEKLQAGWTGK